VFTPDTGDLMNNNSPSYTYVSISFALHPELLEEVDRRALESGRSRSAEVTRAIARDYAREALSA
jgi:metal-responsive CopG/Arc/MetJ family transcriptional regulator